MVVSSTSFEFLVALMSVTKEDRKGDEESSREVMEGYAMLLYQDMRGSEEGKKAGEMETER